MRQHPDFRLMQDHELLAWRDAASLELERRRQEPLVAEALAMTIDELFCKLVVPIAMQEQSMYTSHDAMEMLRHAMRSIARKQVKDPDAREIRLFQIDKFLFTLASFNKSESVKDSKIELDFYSLVA